MERRKDAFSGHCSVDLGTASGHKFFWDQWKKKNIWKSCIKIISENFLKGIYLMLKLQAFMLSFKFFLEQHSVATLPAMLKTHAFTVEIHQIIIVMISFIIILQYTILYKANFTTWIIIMYYYSFCINSDLFRFILCFFLLQLVPPNLLWRVPISKIIIINSVTFSRI